MFGSDSSDGGGDLDRDMYQHHHRHQRSGGSGGGGGGQRSNEPRPAGPGGRDYHHARDQTRLFRSGGSGAGSDMSGLGADLAGEIYIVSNPNTSMSLLA